jgi:hypothetical protein
VINGTNVYNVPVFNAVVVFNDSKKQMKNTEKNRLIIMALGRVGNMLLLHRGLKDMIGSNINAAPIKRSNVRENGLIIPASFSEAKNDPATRIVANMTNR